jgi:arylsulfatase A-like enzyme
MRPFLAVPILVSLPCVLLSALSLGGCGREEPADVILIVLDTVRADHLGCYGYARPTTPNLDAFAKHADRYALARSTAPWTLPSHASLFTGRFPHEHGADARKSGEVFFDAMPLPDNELTLAEMLASEGYATAGIAANFAYVTEGRGLAQGFQHFENVRGRGPLVEAKALEWLAARRATPERAPRFLFLNFMDAHRKYNVTPLEGARASELPPPPARDAGEMLDDFCHSVLMEEAPPAPGLVAEVIDAYDLALANLDASVGRVLDDLRRSGEYDDALILVTSDHGEYFGEHDLVEHSKDVYEPALRVPLIVKRPGQTEGRVLEEPISLADVPKLILAELPERFEAYAPRFPGSSRERGMLAELRYTREKDMKQPYGKRFDRERTVLYSGSWKLIRSSDGRHELYHLANDPGETTNLFESRREVADKLLLRAQYLTYQRRTFEGDPPLEPMSEEMKKAIEEIGY